MRGVCAHPVTCFCGRYGLRWRMHSFGFARRSAACSAWALPPTAPGRATHVPDMGLKAPGLCMKCDAAAPGWGPPRGRGLLLASPAWMQGRGCFASVRAAGRRANAPVRAKPQGCRAAAAAIMQGWCLVGIPASSKQPPRPHVDSPALNYRLPTQLCASSCTGEVMLLAAALSLRCRCARALQGAAVLAITTLAALGQFRRQLQGEQRKGCTQ